MTYNRCPYPPEEAGRQGSGRNPLVWCLSSLLAGGAGGPVPDLVVVDDGSTDFTPDVLRTFADRRSGAGRIRTHRLPEHRGVGYARNVAWQLAETPLVLLIDDDCVTGPGFVEAAETAYRKAIAIDGRAAAVTLPYYTRSRSPRAVVPPSEFGRLDLDNGYFTSNFDCAVKGYAGETGPTPALYPTPPTFPTSMVSGVCVFRREALAEVGGYCELPGWKTAYSDHLELSADLAAAEWRVRHCPDPAAAAIHLKYGAIGEYPPLDEAEQDWVPPGLAHRLGELVAMAAEPRLDTGGRASPGAALEEMIALFFACYARRSRTGGRAFAVRVHRDYVVEGRSYTPAYGVGEPYAVRRMRWRRGLERGLRHALDLCDREEQVRDQFAAACAETGEEVARCG